jgi:HK97 gp10 family phage protein
MNWDASDLHNLGGKLSAADITSAAETVIAKGAADVEAAGKRHSPVDTGFLRSSIGRNVQGLTAEIGPTANYGVFVEMGTSRMRAQPFMAPALADVLPSVEKAFQQVAQGPFT